MGRRSGIVSTVLVCGLLVGCGEDEPAAPAAVATAPAATPVATAAVTVKADRQHALQPGDTVNLDISTTGFTLDAGKRGSAPEAGVGHYRIYLGEPSGEPLLEGAQPKPAVTLPEDINDGTHTLRVVLHGNDGVALEPRAEGTVRLIVYRLD